MPPSASETEPANSSRDGINRRDLLRGLTATGLAGGLAGCLEGVQPAFEAPAVTMSEERASFLGYEPEPTTAEHRVGPSLESATNAVSPIRLTGHSRRWTYRSAFDVNPSGNDGGMGIALPDCDTGIDVGDGPAGPPMGPVQIGGGDDPAGVDDDDFLVAESLPAPNLIGVELNPIAGNAFGDLIRERSDVIERLCDCSFEGSGDVSVETVSPREPYGSREVDETVYAVDGLAEMGLPSTVRLMGTTHPIRAFAFGVTSSDDGVLTHLVLAAKAPFRATNGTRSVVHAAYVARVHWDTLGRPRPIFGEDGLFTANLAEAYVDRLTFACPCLGESPSGQTTDRVADGSPEPQRSSSQKSSISNAAREPTDYTFEPVSMTTAQDLWARARETSETSTIESIASESFGLELEESSLVGYRSILEGTESFVLQISLVHEENDGVYDTLYVAEFDADREFELAALTATMPVEGDEVLVQSVAPADGDRQDFYSTVRKGRIVEMNRRIGSNSTTLASDVRGARSATARGYDFDDIMDSLGCAVCNVVILIVVGKIRSKGCVSAAYIAAGNAVTGISANPMGWPAGWAIAKALCNQLMSKAQDWLFDISTCCICHEIGICSERDCEKMKEEGTIETCGCCSCDDDGGGDGSSGGSTGGGTGTAW